MSILCKTFVCYSTTKTLIIMRAHFHTMSQCARALVVISFMVYSHYHKCEMYANALVQCIHSHFSSFNSPQPAESRPQTLHSDSNWISFFSQSTYHYFYQSTFCRGTNEISCPFLQYIPFVLISLCQSIIIVRAQKSYTTHPSLVAVINYFYY